MENLIVHQFADMLMIIQHVETFERKNSRFHA